MLSASLAFKAFKNTVLVLPVSALVSDPDNDAVSVAVLRAPAVAGARADAAPPGGLAYFPRFNYVGSDGFLIQATDAGNLAATGAVAVTVRARPGV